MREIEIKVRVESLEVVLQNIKSAGELISEPVTQHDRVFGLPGIDGGGQNHAPWLRIRTETKAGHTSHIFTLKKSVTNQLDSIEHETEVANAEELEQIILNSGFEPYSDVTKTRRKATLGDIELCIDHVEGLGDFVEAEKLTAEDADYDAVVLELWKVLEQYGAKREDQVTDGYDVMAKKLEAVLSE